MVKLPFELVLRIVELLEDIAKLKPGFEIYDKAVVLTKDLLKELNKQQRMLDSKRV